MTRDIAINRTSNYVTLPQNLLLTPGTLQEDFETLTGWTFTGVGASHALDTTNFKTGSASIQLTTASGSYAGMRKTVNWNMSNAGRLTFWAYLPAGALTDVQNIEIDLWNDTVGTDYLWYKFDPNNRFLVPGWNQIDVAGIWWNVAGAGSFTNPILRLRFNLQAKSSKIATVSIDSLYWGAQHIPAVMFWFPDGEDDTYTRAYPIMKPHGIRGISAPVTDWIDTANHCTAAQLHEMENNGWIIGNGTKDHTNLSTLTETQQEAEWTSAITALTALGFTKGNYYGETPGGWTALNSDSFTAIKNVGLRTVFTSWHNNTLNPMFLPVMPGYEWPCMSINYVFSSTLAGDLAAVDQAIANKEIIMFAKEGAYLTSDFQSLIDYIVSKRNQIDVITIDDFYNLTLGPVNVPVVTSSTRQTVSTRVLTSNRTAVT